MAVRSKYLGAALFAAGALSSWAWLSSASQSFTMKMEKSARKAWDKSFNKLIEEPFATKLSCIEKSRQSIGQGPGCVDMSEDEQMCCQSWKLNLLCDGGNWKQTTIDAENCRRKKKGKPAAAPTGSAKP